MPRAGWQLCVDHFRLEGTSRSPVAPTLELWVWDPEETFSVEPANGWFCPGCYS